MRINNLKMQSRPVLADGFRLYWDEEEDSYVLLFPEGMIVLNEDDSRILEYCSGSSTIAEIIEEIEQTAKYNNPNDMVRNQLEYALNNGWLVLR